jgi:glucose uptake protein
MIAAIWGICMWKETKGASRGTQAMIGAMFLFFITGLILLVESMLQ